LQRKQPTVFYKFREKDANVLYYFVIIFHVTRKKENKTKVPSGIEREKERDGGAGEGRHIPLNFL